MKKIFIWCSHPLDQEKIEKFILFSPNLNEVIFEQIPSNISLDKVFNFLKENNAWGLLHKNEHGSLLCVNTWIKLCNECLDYGIPVLSFDFGYFDHYKSFMVDFYLKDCVSGIKYEWDLLPTTFDWSQAPQYIQEYRKNILDKTFKYKKLNSNTILKNSVVIWTQWSMDLLRPVFLEKNKYIDNEEWIRKLITLIKERGLNPIVKLSPVKNAIFYQELQKEVTIFVDRENHLQELPYAIYEKEINYKLINEAEYHIINCSSISNELLLNNCKVIAMGKSWFNDLGVFYEPQNWNEILNYQNTQEDNKNKWLNWWLDRQCPLDELRNKIIEIRNRL
jgi:hypothetical protein